jgi:hypothetical protein
MGKITDHGDCVLWKDARKVAGRKIPAGCALEEREQKKMAKEGKCGSYNCPFYKTDEKGACVLRERVEVFREYFAYIRRSLDAPYPYDIVGHIGYIARYVPFEDKSFSLEEFGEEIDDILKTIIAKDKILEVNSATKNLPQLCRHSE